MEHPERLRSESASIPATTSLRIAALTDIGMVRKRNEDAVVFADLSPDASPPSANGRIDVGPAGVLVAVADGMGGHADGDRASAMAVGSVLRSMRDVSVAAHERLRNAIVRAHAEVSEATKAARGKARMGTTLTAIHIDGRRAYIGHVGDSRAYVVRGGLLQRLTRDHSYTQTLIDMGLLRPSERALSPYPHVLTQALGQDKSLQVDSSTLYLRDGDTLVLCSDGLTNRVDEDEIARIVRSGGPFDETCRSLVDLAKLRGGEDNITVLLAGVRASVSGEHSLAMPPSQSPSTIRTIVSDAPTSSRKPAA